MPIAWKSESLNHLEPSGPVLSYTGIALNLMLEIRLSLRIYCLDQAGHSFVR